jgi:hypothetical protein
MLRQISVFLLFALSFGATATPAAASPEQPTISSVSPTSGPVGTVITVDGSGFSGVFWGDIGAGRDATVHVVSDTQLKITVPSDATTGALAVGNSQKYAYFTGTFTVTKGGGSSPPPTGGSLEITGNVSGDVAEGVTITLNGANVGSTVTDQGGNYTFSGVASGTYTVSAALSGYSFSAAKVVTIGNVDSVSNNFTSKVTPSDSLVFSSVTTLPTATVGKAYSASTVKEIAGGTAQYHLQSGTLQSGAPPLDMIVNNSGSLIGTPKSVGEHTWAVCPTDSAGNKAPCKSTSVVVAAATTTPPPAPTPPPPPASGTSWVYYDGALGWPGDYSYSAVPNYHDTSGGPLSGSYDIKVTSAPWGGWLPYAQNWSFNSKPYTKLTFALKPTAANQKWHVYFVRVGDVPVGVSVDASNYGPKPVAGKWATYTIPLADLGVLGTSIYKFAIQDQSGLSNNVWYVDNVGFEP